MTAWEKHKPRGNGRDPVSAKTPLYKGRTVIEGSDLSLRWSLRGKQRDGTGVVVKPPLEDEGGSSLVDNVAADMAIGGIPAGGFEGEVHLRGGEALVPEVDGESRMLRLSDEGFQFTGKAMDARGLGTCLSRESQGIADDDAGASMAARETKDRALIAPGLRALDGEQRLGDTERVGEGDADAARADVEAEPRLRLCAHSAYLSDRMTREVPFPAMGRPIAED